MSSVNSNPNLTPEEMQAVNYLMMLQKGAPINTSKTSKVTDLFNEINRPIPPHAARTDFNRSNQEAGGNAKTQIPNMGNRHRLTRTTVQQLPPASPAPSTITTVATRFQQQPPPTRTTVQQPGQAASTPSTITTVATRRQQQPPPTRTTVQQPGQAASTITTVATRFQQQPQPTRTTVATRFQQQPQPTRTTVQQPGQAASTPSTITTVATRRQQQPPLTRTAVSQSAVVRPEGALPIVRPIQPPPPPPPPPPTPGIVAGRNQGPPWRNRPANSHSLYMQHILAQPDPVRLDNARKMIEKWFQEHPHENS